MTMLLPHIVSSRVPFICICTICYIYASLSATQAAADTPACGIFPPPFSATRAEVPEAFGLKNPFIPEGYTETPILNIDCKHMPVQAHAAAVLIDGIPMKIVIHAILHDGRDIDRMNAFARHYLGELPEDMRTRPESERYTGIHADWSTSSYEATYSIKPDSDHPGMYDAHIFLISPAYHAQDTAQQHYVTSENNDLLPNNITPSAPAGILPAHASDM